MNESAAPEIEFLRLHSVEVAAPEGKQVCGPCWIPHGREKDYKRVNDYVDVKYRGEKTQYHRIAAIARCGLPAPGQVAAHECDRKACCSPLHVLFVSAQKNSMDAVERGLTRPVVRKMPRGEDNRRSSTTNPFAANIRWLIENRDVWYTGQLKCTHSPLWALSVHFSMTMASLRAMMRHRTWAWLTPVKPSVFPSVATVPEGSLPPKFRNGGVLGEEAVRNIIQGYWDAENKKHYVAEMAAHYGVTNVAVYSVLHGKTHATHAPELPRIPTLTGNFSLTAHQVDELRATADANPRIPGIFAALGRHFAITSSHAKNVAARKARLDVPEKNSVLAIPLCELPFKSLTPRGESHPSAKLSVDEVNAIISRLSRGEKGATLAAEYQVSQALISRIKLGKCWKYDEVTPQCDSTDAWNAKSKTR